MGNEVEKTSEKRAKKPGKGGVILPDAPKPFTKENQPTPEAKSEGWKKMRAERLLTQGILQYMTQGTNLHDYIKSLYVNAAMGNSKAIETINKGIEEDIIKIASTDSEGNDKPVKFILDERYRDKNDSGIPT